MQAQHCALVVVHHVLVVGREEERGHRAGGARCRLDHVGHVPLVGQRVEVVEPFTGVLRVLLQVVIGPLGDAFEFVEAPWERELHVGGPR